MAASIWPCWPQAGLIGFSFRGDRAAAQSHVFEIGVTIYSLLVMALVIVTIVTVIQRFTKNLLAGRAT